MMHASLNEILDDSFYGLQNVIAIIGMEKLHFLKNVELKI